MDDDHGRPRPVLRRALFRQELLTEPNIDNGRALLEVNAADADAESVA